MGCKLCPARMVEWPGHNHVQITHSTHGAYYVQHVMCHDKSAFKFDRVEITIILAIFNWLKPLTDAGGKETGVPKENPRG